MVRMLSRYTYSIWYKLKTREWVLYEFKNNRIRDWIDGSDYKMLIALYIKTIIEAIYTFAIILSIVAIVAYIID